MITDLYLRVTVVVTHGVQNTLVIINSVRINRITFAAVCALSDVWQIH